MTPLIGKSKNRFLILLEKNYSVFVLESLIKGPVYMRGGGPQVRWSNPPFHIISYFILITFT